MESNSNILFFKEKKNNSRDQTNREIKRNKLKKGNNKDKVEETEKEVRSGGEITGIATADHEDARRSGDIFANKRTESRVTLVPIEGAALLHVSRVPVEGVAIVVCVAARHVPVHV